MGWQDRDYAREQPPVSPGGRGLIAQYGIVNLLIIVNIGIYIANSLIQGEVTAHERLIYHLGSLVPEKVWQGQVWRLVTAQYLHYPYSLLHITVNMIGLYFLGPPLERLWSARKFFIVYTLCGLAGNIFYVLLATQVRELMLTPAVGASGCIYGLLGIVAVRFPYATLYVYFLIPIRIRTAAVIFGILAFWSVITRGQNYGGEACHLAGLIFGVWWAAAGEEWWRSTEWRLPWKKSRTK